MLAQSARQSGLRVAALDAFGDRDTRAASALWFDVGSQELTIDRGRLVDALRRIARLPRIIGWIAGSGTEPLIDELSTLPGLPAFVGNDPQAARAVRDPRRFFALLDELGIPHPPVSFTRPSEPGWLFKRADGCGGTHVMPAAMVDEAHSAPCPHGYFQRQQSGQPFSALFVAAQGRATVLGFARQLTASIGGLPYVHTGSVGPVHLPEPLARRLREAVEAVSARAGVNGLKGLNSCDFLVDGDEFSLLEINARPSSTMWLYEAASPRHWPFGLLAEHLEACLRGRLAAPPSERERCAGQQVLFAPHALTCSTAFSDACVADPGCRDVPMPGMPIEAGAPLCTLVAFAASPEAVMQALAQQRKRVLERIDTSTEPDHVLLVKHG
jgi:predicted ATP-grasp superfamily ATP-dependent carboligase